MGIARQSLPNEKSKLPLKSIQHTVNLCYDRFFSKDARRNAASMASPQLSNFLIRLRDFSTIIEAEDSIKAGFKAPPPNDSTHHKIPTTSSLPRITEFNSNFTKWTSKSLCSKGLLPRGSKLLAQVFLQSQWDWHQFPPFERCFFSKNSYGFTLNISILSTSPLLTNPTAF